MYDKNYIMSSDRDAQEQVHCMRCDAVIMTHTYEMMPLKQRPTEKVPVYAPLKHSTYKLVPVLTQNGDRSTVLHLPHCDSCARDFALTDEIAASIVKQIAEATASTLKWSGYPDEIITASNEKYSNTKVLRHLKGEELQRIYASKIGGR